MAGENAAIHRIELWAADLTQSSGQLQFQKIECAMASRLAAGCGTIGKGSTGKNETCTERFRAHDIGPAAHPTVEKQRYSAAHRLGNVRQNRNRSRTVVDLATAMVGYDNPVASRSKSQNRIMAMQNALEQKQPLPLVSKATQIVPIEVI